jgi:hypothetical protein
MVKILIIITKKEKSKMKLSNSTGSEEAQGQAKVFRSFIGKLKEAILMQL